MIMMKRLPIFLVAVIAYCLCSNSVHAQKKQSADKTLFYLEDVSYIDTVPLHTFYKIKKYTRVTHEKKEYFTSFETGDNLMYQLFFVCPVYDTTKAFDYTPEDTLMMFQNEDFSYREVYGKPVNNKIYAYIGYVFEKAIDNKLTAAQKQSAKDDFVKNATKEYYEISWKKKIEYYERIDSGYEYESYMHALHLNGNKKPIIFIPKFEPFKQ